MGAPMTAPTDADIASAARWLDEHKRRVPFTYEASDRFWFSGPYYDTTLGGCIVQAALANGWHPTPITQRTYTREEVLAFGERVREWMGGGLAMGSDEEYLPDERLAALLDDQEGRKT